MCGFISDIVDKIVDIVEDVVDIVVDVVEDVIGWLIPMPEIPWVHCVDRMKRA